MGRGSGSKNSSFSSSSWLLLLLPLADAAAVTAPAVVPALGPLLLSVASLERLLWLLVAEEAAMPDSGLGFEGLGKQKKHGLKTLAKIELGKTWKLMWQLAKLDK